LLTLATTGVLGGASAFFFASATPSLGSLCGIGATAALLVPTLIRNCPWNGSVLRSFQTPRREVWLTIDDGPTPQETPPILEVLAKHQARATFFLIGERVRRWPHLALSIHDAGHSLQNHTLSHPSATFWAATPQQARREIAEGNRAIQEASGTKPCLFRSPVGLSNPFVHQAASAAGLKIIGWSANALDGIGHKPERMVASLLAQVKPGSIILIHEGPLNGLPLGQRARSLDRLLTGLKEIGYSLTVPLG
jgi:peptidoglycan/xylan/chitin deacetylase (PgdA/CDA1 family)